MRYGWSGGPDTDRHAPVSLNSPPSVVQINKFGVEPTASGVFGIPEHVIPDTRRGTGKEKVRGGLGGIGVTLSDPFGGRQEEARSHRSDKSRGRYLSLGRRRLSPRGGRWSRRIDSRDKTGKDIGHEHLWSRSSDEDYPCPSPCLTLETGVLTHGLSCLR